MWIRLQCKVYWSACPNLLISLYRWLWHSGGATGGHHLVSAPNSRQARKSTTDSFFGVRLIDPSAGRTTRALEEEGTWSYEDLLTFTLSGGRLVCWTWTDTTTRFLHSSITCKLKVSWISTHEPWLCRPLRRPSFSTNLRYIINPGMLQIVPLQWTCILANIQWCNDSVTQWKSIRMSGIDSSNHLPLW